MSMPRAGECPHCGAVNPPTALACQFCGGALPVLNLPPPPPGVPPPDNFRLVTAGAPAAANPVGVVLLVVGIVLLLIGIGLLAAAAAAHQAVSSFNQACSQNPLCQPQTDPSGGMTAGGVVLLLIGVVLIAFGAVRLRS